MFHRIGCAYNSYRYAPFSTGHFPNLSDAFAGNNFRRILHVRYPDLVHIPNSMRTILVAS